MRRVKPEDLYNFKFVHDPAISPDGNEILFSVTQTKGADSYAGSIWKYSSNGRIEPLIFTGVRTSGAAWAADGEKFLFTSSDDDDEGRSELWIANADGLDRRKILSLSGRSIAEPKWSKDGGQFVYFISDYDEDIQQHRGSTETDVRLITRMNYRFDGEGYLHNKRSHVFRVSVESGKITRITFGKFDVATYDLSPDGSTVAFVSNIDGDADFQNNLDIYSVPASGGGAPKRLTQNRGSIVSLAYSSDGKSMAFVGDDYRFKFNTPVEVWVYDLEKGSSHCISHELDRPARNSIVCDVMMDKEPAKVRWSGDSRSVFFLATDRGRCNLYSADVDSGRVAQLTRGDQVVTNYSLSKDGSKIALVKMDPTHLPEIFRLVRNGAELEPVSNFNGPLLSQVAFSDLKEFTFRASDGIEVHGFLIPPAAQQESPPACVVEIHGGGGTEGFQFMFEFQCLAALGYCVLTCNFRGTAGYGEEFMRVLTGHYMEKDYSDIIDMVDHAIGRGWIDGTRVGVTGGSYGGYLTNWAIGHSKLFSAAVTDRSVVNLFSFYGTSDDYRLIEEDVQMSFPWDRPEHYLAKSPISYTKNITTPLLIMHAEEDFRCRLEQAEQLYAFLKRQGKEVVFAVFPGESHGLSRGGRPHHRVERLNLMLWWFTSHIKTGEGLVVECPIRNSSE